MLYYSIVVSGLLFAGYRLCQKYNYREQEAITAYYYMRSDDTFDIAKKYPNLDSLMNYSKGSSKKFDIYAKEILAQIGIDLYHISASQFRDGLGKKDASNQILVKLTSNATFIFDDMVPAEKIIKHICGMFSEDVFQLLKISSLSRVIIVERKDKTYKIAFVDIAPKNDGIEVVKIFCHFYMG